MTDEYKIRIENLGEKISEIIDNADNMRSIIDNKTSEIDSYISVKKEEINKKIENIFADAEEDTLKKLNDIRELIDDAVEKYKYEIKEIESYRLEENKNIMHDIENIGADIKKDYERYTDMLEDIYNKEKASLNDHANILKDDIEKSRAESEAKHLSYESNYIDEYLNKASLRIDEEVDRLNDDLNNSLHCMPPSLRSQSSSWTGRPHIPERL